MVLGFGASLVAALLLQVALQLHHLLGRRLVGGVPLLRLPVPQLQCRLQAHTRRPDQRRPALRSVRRHAASLATVPRRVHPDLSRATDVIQEAALTTVPCRAHPDHSRAADALQEAALLLRALPGP